jgi:hypothetical protein
MTPPEIVAAAGVQRDAPAPRGDGLPS